MRSLQRFVDGLSIRRSIVEALGGLLWAIPNESHGAVSRILLQIDEISHKNADIET